MSEGRTFWYSEDVGTLRRGLVVVLGQEFGPDVLAVYWVLRAEAKLQNNAGRILTGYAAVARDSFMINHESRSVTESHALSRKIIERAANLGILDEHETLPDGYRFRCRISGWENDQDRGSAAFRQAKLRASRRSSNGTSRSVTESHACHEDRTGQDRTEKKRVLRTPKEMRAFDDAAARLRARVLPKFRGRPVKAEQWQLTVEVLAAYCEQAGKSHKALTAEGEPSESAKRIYGRVCAFPELTLAEHEDIIRRTLSSKWWGTGPPSVGAIYGPAVFEDNIARSGTPSTNRRSQSPSDLLRKMEVV